MILATCSLPGSWGNSAQWLPHLQTDHRCQGEVSDKMGKSSEVKQDFFMDCPPSRSRWSYQTDCWALLGRRYEIKWVVQRKPETCRRIRWIRSCYCILSIIIILSIKFLLMSTNVVLDHSCSQPNEPLSKPTCPVSSIWPRPTRLRRCISDE